MDHVALDRTRPDDRDLHDDVVEARRLEARQHRHLRARLDLEHADRVGALQHLVGRRVVGRNVVERERRPLGIAAPEHRERVAQQREHAQAEQVDLDQPEVGEIVLVPLHDRAVAHRRPLDRRDLDQRRARDHHPAAVDPHVARETVDAPADAQQQRAHRRRRPGRATCASGAMSSDRCRTAAGTWWRTRRRLENRARADGRASPPARRRRATRTRSSRRRDRGAWRSRPATVSPLRTPAPSAPASDSRASYSRTIWSTWPKREPERFADVANRRARAVGDHFGGHRGVLAAVAAVDVLDHLLAVLVREVDVDVGDLAALLAQKPLEQQLAFDRVDRGDAQRITHRRVGRRTAALREHAEPARGLRRCPTPPGSSRRDPSAR